MPLIPLAVAFLVLLMLVLAMPFLLVQRYRIGIARRRGRQWVATLNLVLILLSVGVFLSAAAITNYWVPSAFLSSLLGLAGGTVLGAFGLALTKWEETPQALYYTPNRWLVLLITFAVALRLLYGFWRGGRAWSGPEIGTSWVAAAGIAGSLAVGAIVLGYYVTYSTGIRRRLTHHRKLHGV